MARRTMLFALAIAGSWSAAGQAPRREPTPNDTLVSPEVLSDRHVTFRVYAPKATEVTLRCDCREEPRPAPLEKDDQGVWSLTLGPLTPDFYNYAFNVDGVKTVDPKNPLIKSGAASNDSMFEVPGEEAAFEANALVPHGLIRVAWYQSSTLDMPRRMHIYTPPGYDGGSARYPVLYLLHGGGDEDSGWSTIGRAGFILDNLIAQKKAKPMIVVMPNGSLPRPANAAPGGTGTFGDPAKFSRELLNDVVPHVEKNYRVMATKDARAIAGLSMGASQTMWVSFANPDKFGYIAIWSNGVRPEQTESIEKQFATFLDNPDKTNKAVKLLWIGIGAKDALAPSAKNLVSLLDKHNIRHEFHESEGGHTWINWRHYLDTCAPLLFR